MSTAVTTRNNRTVNCIEVIGDKSKGNVLRLFGYL